MRVEIGVRSIDLKEKVSHCTFSKHLDRLLRFQGQLSKTVPMDRYMCVCGWQDLRRHPRHPPPHVACPV